jgi:hypothetical protein
VAAQHVHVYVDGVDRHFEQARRPGDVVDEPRDEPYGDRRYDGEDLGGSGGRSPSTSGTSRPRSGAQ